MPRPDPNRPDGNYYVKIGGSGEWEIANFTRARGRAAWRMDAGPKKGQPLTDYDFYEIGDLLVDNPEPPGKC